MAKQFIREINSYANLYRDDKNGIAWIEDNLTGMGISVHANIASNGSVSGMKRLGYWGKNDRVVTSHGFKYNIDTLVYDKDDEMEMIVLNECRCQACLERRNEQ